MNKVYFLTIHGKHINILQMLKTQHTKDAPMYAARRGWASEMIVKAKVCWCLLLLIVCKMHSIASNGTLLPISQPQLVSNLRNIFPKITIDIFKSKSQLMTKSCKYSEEMQG